MTSAHQPDQGNLVSNAKFKCKICTEEIFGKYNSKMNMENVHKVLCLYHENLHQRSAYLNDLTLNLIWECLNEIAHIANGTKMWTNSYPLRLFVASK